jgi:putative phosphoribosyl transferase
MGTRFHTRHHMSPHSGRGAGLRGGRTSPAAGFLRFDDRRQAGRVLADWLVSSTPADALVVGVAGGGAIVAEEVAQALELPLDVIAVEPVPLPGAPGVDCAAVAADGTMEVDADVLAERAPSSDAMYVAVRHARDRVARRAAACMLPERPGDLQDRTVLVVDEALGSGVVAATAAASARRRGAARVIVAVPIGDRAAVQCTRRVADEVIAVLMPQHAGPRARWYGELPPVSDAEVAEILAFRLPLD